jgi:hypothetical protein
MLMIVIREMLGYALKLKRSWLGWGGRFWLPMPKD